jgi:tetratricopeptide (TPR) repeat protein
MEGLKQLIHEIHRRSLWQVLLIYLVGAWVVFEVVQTLTEGLRLPTWFPALALVLLLIGLPIVLATAFVQEGVRSPAQADPTLIPTSAADPGSQGPRTSRPAGVRRLFTWRNALLGGTIALAAWGAVAALWLLAFGPPDRDVSAASGPISASAIAVLPFLYQGSEEYAYLGEGIADLLSTKLDGAGELRSVDPRAVLSLVGEGAEANLDPRAATRVARTLAAGRFVLGSIVEAGDRLTLSAVLYEAGATPAPLGEAEAAGRAEEVFEVVDDLAADLLAELGTGPAARVRRIAAVTTNSLPALKAYLEGERAYRLGQYQDATEDFQRAVALDTAYALAHYRLSILAEYVTQAELAQAAAEQAVRFAGRLPERDRRMFEAFLAWRRGAHGEAERLYRSLVGSYPDEVEAWFELGEVLFHSNPSHGRSFTEGREPFERVLFYDPGNTGALYHLARIAAFERRLADMDSLIVRHNALIEGGDRELEMLALQAFARAEPELEDVVVERLAHASDVILALATWDVATWAKNLDGAIRLASLLAEPSRSVEVRTLGHAWLAHMRLAKGRYQAAMAELDQMARLDPVAALEYRALLTAFPYMPATDVELVDLRARLEALDPHAVASSGNPSVFFSAHDDLHPVLREYLLGILNVKLGAYHRAESHALALDSMPRPPGTGTMLSDFATSIRAQILLAEGRPLEALARLEGVEREIWYNVGIASTFWAQPLERFLLAETLFELGRDDEAIPWYANIAQVAPFEVAHRSIAYLRLGEIYDRKGDRERAADWYRKFVDLWSGADPELQPQVEAAERGLAAIAPNR